MKLTEAEMRMVFQIESTLGPLDLVAILSSGRFSVIEADDRSRCHISAVLCAAENESEAFPSAPAAALGHPQGTAG